ncbi:putative uncharacterized protein DDB_G0282133 isoform X2 [Nymphalis io]|uniref:putative uncharacterized protein DDB_G0282133 isoform X2 n=1 Tax=Inachis io TaxID=171585 RepID=UPI0021695AF8|nr:putative uncharacterized protein DDB_G0282133 isoform X2 [Nymphalis io]
MLFKMRLLILICSIWALAYGKPEMYKEKEDFQFSRSSSDDGSKSGYYGAQRGNMGGNYEKAHNMDSLAQHQMSTLVRQVDGELGEGANTRTGSVFTSGNSRGLYGSGNYDLTNLHGRNFDEGVSFGDSQSHSSLSSQHSGYTGSSYSAANNARYSANQLRASGLSSTYRQAGLASNYGQFDNQQAESQYSGASNYERGSQAASNYKYYSHGGSQARSEYDQSSTNLNSFSNSDDSSKSRLITTPVRVYVRPGTRVAIPVAAQTYDASQSSSLHDLNAVNTEADLLSISGQRVNTIKPKHYESSYSYRKEWEKHDVQPVTVMPTENPFPKNSELYEDTQLSQAAGQRYQSVLDSSNLHSSASNTAYARDVNSGYANGYTANTKSAAANRLQYQSQQQSSGISANSNLYALDTQNSGVAANSNNLVENTNSRPKSYHSSYSYHKSWERRGDPYVIKPVGGDLNGQASQRLLAAAADQNLYSSGLYGNQYSQTKTSCDELCHLRKRRSYDIDWANFDTLGQQTQNKWDDLDSLGQQTQNQWGNLEDLGQQTQNKWDNLESLNQHPQSGFEELSQQPQSQLSELEDLGQQTQNIDNLESFNQHPQSGFEELSQQPQSQLSELEDLGQQTQNIDNLESFNQHPQSGFEVLSQKPINQLGDLADLGQQTQSKWDNLESLSQHPQSGFKELSQQPQNQFGNLEDLGQQTQNIDNLESFNQHPQSGFEVLSQKPINQLGDLADLGQQTQSKWDNLESLSQHPQSGFKELSQQPQNQFGNLEDLGQQTQTKWDNLESLNQHPQSGFEELSQQPQNQLGNSEDLGQQTQTKWDNLESLNQHQSQSGFEELPQQTQSQSDHFKELGQQIQNTWDNLEKLNQQSQDWSGGLEGQQSQSQWHNLESLGQEKQNQWNNFENSGQQTQNLWDKFEQLTPQKQDKSNDQQTFNTWNRIEDQQSRNFEEYSRHFEHQNSGDNLSQTMFSHNMQPVWNKINSLEAQKNIESTMVSHQQVSFNQETNWNGYKGNFNQVVTKPQDDPYQDFTSSQVTVTNDEKKHTLSNTELSLWDTIDKLIKESEKNKDTLDNKQQLDSNTSNFKVGEGQSTNNNYHNTHYEHNFKQSSETITDKSVQSTESNKNKETDSKNKITLAKSNKTEINKNGDSTNRNTTKPIVNEVGRGDIGPEDTPVVSIETSGQNHDDKVEDFVSPINSNKLYKTQQEIESLSLKHTNEDQYVNKLNEEPIILSVIGLEHQVGVTSTPTTPPTLKYVNKYNDDDQTIIQKEFNTPSFNTPSVVQTGVQPEVFEQQQQHFAPTFVDTEQQISNMHNSFMDFGQQQQVEVPFSKNMHQELYTPQEIGNSDTDLQSMHERVQTKVPHDNHNKESLNGNQRSNHNVNNLESVPKNQDMLIEPIEPTEKPGFWNSVWNKTKKAKESVVAWFKS